MSLVRQWFNPRWLILGFLVIVAVLLTAAVSNADPGQDLTIEFSVDCVGGDDDDDDCDDDDDDGGAWLMRFRYDTITQDVTSSKGNYCRADGVNGPIVDLDGSIFKNGVLDEVANVGLIEGLGINNESASSSSRECGQINLKGNGNTEVLDITPAIGGMLVESVDFYVKANSRAKGKVEFFRDGAVVGSENFTIRRKGWLDVGPFGNELADSVRISMTKGYVSLRSGTINLQPATPDVKIFKFTNGADPTSTDPNYIPIGQPVTWTYVVENVGNVPLTNVVVTDNKPVGAINRIIGSGDVLAPGAKWTYSASGTSVAAGTFNPTTEVYDLPIVPYSNTGSVSAQSVFDASPDGTVTDGDGSGYFGPDPSITVEVTGPDGPVTIGDVFTWLFDVTNDGNVPLRGTVVLDGGPMSDIEICDLGILDPAETGSCSVQETATADSGTSVFTAKGTFEGGGDVSEVVEETIENVTIDLNFPPDAGEAEEYDSPERDEDGTVVLAVPATAGVLANASDPDDDDLRATVKTTTTKGTLALSEDGSFTYTPTYEWASNDEVSYTDTFEYWVEDLDEFGDPKGGIDMGMATITITRQLCVTEVVEGGFGNLFASFQLVSFEGGCKLWPLLEVDPADISVDGEVLFQPPAQSTLGTYRGEITIEEVDISDGLLTEVVLKYDPDPSDGENFDPVPACDGDVANPVLPVGPDTWCFYDLQLELQDDLFDLTWLLHGQEDPRFKFS